MRLVDRMLDQGRSLFRLRSVIPLVFLPLIVLALPESWNAEAWLGVRGNLAFQWSAISLGLLGLALRCVAVVFAPDGSSSRDTHQLRATSLNTMGAYSIVRHPLYVGNGLLWVGAVLSLRVWWLAAVVALAYWLYIERVMLAEEAYLEDRFGDAFREWTAVTPAIVPRLKLWRRPAAPPRWKRLLGEHNAFLGLAASVTLFEYVEDQQHGGETLAQWYRVHDDLVWLCVVAIVASLVAVALRRWQRLWPVQEPS